VTRAQRFVQVLSSKRNNDVRRGPQAVFHLSEPCHINVTCPGSLAADSHF
jgi:hypothetical protein